MWFWLNFGALLSGFGLLTALVVLSRPSLSNETALNEMLAVLFSFFLLAVLSFLASYRGVTMREADTFSDVILGLIVGLTLYYEWRLYRGFGTLRLPRFIRRLLPAVGAFSVVLWIIASGLYTGEQNGLIADFYLGGGLILHGSITVFTLLAAHAGTSIARSTDQSIWRSLYRGFASACRIIALAHLLNWVTVNLVLQNVIFTDATMIHTEVVFVTGYMIANTRLVFGILKTLGEGGVSFSGTAAPRDDILEYYGITEREAEILTLLCEGYTNAQMAEKLGISVRTVDTHVGNLLSKCGVGSRLELYKLVTGRETAQNSSVAGNR